MDARWKTGNSSLTLSLRCVSQIDAADLSHVICTQGVNSIINSRCRYYNSGYNGLAGRPCSAQLKLDSSDVDVDVDVECRNVGIFLALLSYMGKMLPLPFPLPGGFSTPSNPRLHGGSLVGFH